MVKNIMVMTEADSVLQSWDLQGRESIAYAHGGFSESAGEKRYLIRKVAVPESQDYRSQDACSASTKSGFVYRVYRKAREKGLPAVIFKHTHPGQAYFSQRDEHDLQTHLKVLPDFNIGFYIRIVVGEDGLVADVHCFEKGEWQRGSIDYIILYKVRGIDIIFPKNSCFKPDFMIDEELHDRTLKIGGGIEKALGLIGFSTWAVIGAGGVGAAFLNAFKFLGVQHLAIVDPDRLEKSNANRFMGYRHGDEGKFKVDVLKRELLEYNPNMEIETYAEAFPSENTREALKKYDFVICTPDHHWHRLRASEYCSHFLKPLFSGGAGIYADEKGNPYRLSASTWLQLPRLGPCLKCLGLKANLPPHYEEMVNQARRSYIKGFRDPGPTPASVVTLHNECANLLVRHILFYLSDLGDAPVPLHFVYDEMPSPRFEDLTSLFPRRQDCSICGTDSFYAYGDFVPRIPSKQEMEADLGADPPALFSGGS